MPTFERDIYLEDVSASVYVSEYFDGTTTVETTEDVEIDPGEFINECSDYEIEELIHLSFDGHYDSALKGLISRLDNDMLREIVETIAAYLGTDIPVETAPSEPAPVPSAEAIDQALTTLSDHLYADRWAQAIQTMLEFPDDIFQGPPEDLLEQLRTRLGTATGQTVQVAEDRNYKSTLNQILSSIEPNQPLSESMLNEMRLLTE